LIPIPDTEECPDSVDVCVVKFYDRDADGVWDEGEESIEGWVFDIDGAGGYTTPYCARLPQGRHTFCELEPNENCWVATTSTCVEVNVHGTRTNRIVFGNVCLCCGGREPHFWAAPQGEAAIANDIDGGLTTALDVLAMASLRNPDGSLAVIDSYAALSAFVVNNDVTNAAFVLSKEMLSAILGALASYMDVDAPVWDGTSFRSLSSILIEANDLVTLYGVIDAAHPERPAADALIAWLQRANTACGFVGCLKPCCFSFGDDSCQDKDCDRGDAATGIGADDERDPRASLRALFPVKITPTKPGRGGAKGIGQANGAIN
jgi:hypothetical protein